MADVGPVERVSGRSAILMVGDGIVKFFAILRLAFIHALEGFESIGSVAKRGPGCKGTSFFATFFATEGHFTTQDTVSERPTPLVLRVV